MDRRRFLGLVFIALSSAVFAQERSGQPNFKGSELYSWPTDQGWRYSLLPGTNRNKNWAEVQKAGVSFESLTARLKLLAVGEMISWTHHAQNAPPQTLRLSPHWKEIEELCVGLGIQIFIEGRPSR